MSVQNQDLVRPAPSSGRRDDLQMPSAILETKLALVRNGDQALRLGGSGPEVLQLKKDLMLAAKNLAKDPKAAALGLTEIKLDLKNENYTAQTKAAVEALQTWQRSQQADSNVWASNRQFSKVDGIAGLRTIHTLDAINGSNAMLSKSEFTKRVNSLEGLVGDMQKLGAITPSNVTRIKSTTDAWESFSEHLKQPEVRKKITLATFEPEPKGHTTLASTTVPFISQYNSIVPGASDGACYRACRTMLAAIGESTSPSTRGALQIAASETYNGRVSSVYNNNLSTGLEAVIDTIKNGGAVIAGMAHRAGSPNRNNITDHYVVLHTARKDGNGNIYFLGNDPSTRHTSKGSNIAYYPDEKGNLVKAGSTFARNVIDKRQELAELIFPKKRPLG